MLKISSKLRFKILADAMFISHILVVLVILFGWFFPSIFIFYLSILVFTLVFETTLGYCPLSKWEFDLRKRINPDLSYDYSFLSFYAYKILKRPISKNLVKYTAIIFLSLSIAINLFPMPLIHVHAGAFSISSPAFLN